MILLPLYRLNEVCEKQSGSSPRTFLPTPVQISNRVGIIENMKNASSAKQAKQLAGATFAPACVYTGRSPC